MSAPDNLPYEEFVASRSRRPKFPMIDGVATHAQERCRERLGVDLPRATWQAILEGVVAERWAWENSGNSRVFHVPVEVDGKPGTLPVVVGYGGGKPTITTVLWLLP